MVITVSAGNLQASRIVHWHGDTCIETFQDVSIVALSCIFQDNRMVSLDANVPLADFLRPEDDTLHSITDMSLPSKTYRLFTIVKSEEERCYSCIKTGGEASGKW